VILIRRASRASDRAAACGHRLIEASTCSGLLRNVRGRRSRASSLARESVVQPTHIRRMLIGVDPAWRAQTASRQCTSCRWYQSLTALWVCASAPISAGVQTRTARLERAAHARPPCSARQRLTESTAAGATRTKSLEQSQTGAIGLCERQISSRSDPTPALLTKSAVEKHLSSKAARAREALTVRVALDPRGLAFRAQQKAAPAAATLGDKLWESASSPSFPSRFDIRHPSRRGPPAVGLIRRPSVSSAARRSVPPAVGLTRRPPP